MIKKQIILGDKQRIHVMGSVDVDTMRGIYRECLYGGFDDLDDVARIQHRMTNLYIKKYNKKLYHWLKENRALTTGWVDPDIFFDHMPSMKLTVDYGIGFRHNDDMESLFVLRWA